MYKNLKNLYDVLKGIPLQEEIFKEDEELFNTYRLSKRPKDVIDECKAEGVWHNDVRKAEERKLTGSMSETDRIKAMKTREQHRIGKIDNDLTRTVAELAEQKKDKSKEAELISKLDMVLRQDSAIRQNILCGNSNIETQLKDLTAAEQELNMMFNVYGKHMCKNELWVQLAMNRLDGRPDYQKDIEFIPKKPVLEEDKQSRSEKLIATK